jgi:aryl-alcohol dehydrogenase-like predicted oxidoreductase
MENRKIGSLSVSVIGLGCNNFGMTIDEKQTADVVGAALDAGINFFDTADTYGGTNSERFLGKALGTRRHEAIVATKFGMKASDELPGGAKPEYVRKACDASLKRLNIDRIDLYQLHKPDPSTHIADTIGAMTDLVRAGKVREIGCSNFSVAQLREADGYFVSVQNEYSLLHRDPEADVLPECARTGRAFLPYFPLANGLLTGKYAKGVPPPKGTRMQSMGWARSALTDKNLAIVEGLKAIAGKRGHSMLDLAFSWLLRHDAVASVIAGATKSEQVRANAQAGGWKISKEDLAAISERL